MDRSCSFASSLLMKGSFPSTPCGAGQASCLPGRSPGYQGLQKKQIRAIHTGSFLSAFARLITPGGEAVTPAGSNLVPRESCLPCMCVYPRRCGSWKPCLSLWFLAPAVVSQTGHHGLSGSSHSPRGASSGQDLGEVLLNSSLILHRCLYGAAKGVCAEPAWLWHSTARAPISSLLPAACGERCWLQKTRRARRANKKRHENS